MREKRKETCVVVIKVRLPNNTPRRNRPKIAGAECNSKMQETKHPVRDVFD
jgi:hypothetical protein